MEELRKKNDDKFSSDEEEEEPEVEIVEEDLKRKKKRFKCFLVFHGDRKARKLPHSVRVSLPRDGSWDTPRALREAFGKRYAEVRGCALDPFYLVDSRGIPLDDEDSLKLYVSNLGTLHVVLGRVQKPPPNKVVQFGYTQAPHLPFRVVRLDAGWLHVVVVLETGACAAWGSNEFGQLGTGDDRKTSNPVLCEIDGVASVACGSYFSCALTKAGDLYSWGRYQASNSPTRVADTWVNGSKGGIKGEVITMVACGESHTVAATARGALFSWGYNEQWQLGWGEREQDRQGQQKPRKVLNLSNVISLSAGGQHTCAITADNLLYGWGSNAEGQIGQVVRQSVGEPKVMPLDDGVAKVVCGRHATLAISQGRAYLWGSLTGSSSSAASSSSEDQKGEEGQAPEFGKLSSGVTKMLAGAQKQLVATGVEDARLGEAHGLILAQQLKGWGYNAYGQAVGKSEPDFVDEPATISTVLDYAAPIDMSAAGGTTTLLLPPKEE
ncbi:hypothetical protein CTAYLR_005157 [Chrysophaeum taylorii]|uniref:RCC1-like domain-containing protein n=1 Tax=Chrysophaeum taylorii TaxID=2483200 RepID=A0AAD7ULL4_9STRA|nr:hypothetical protein CTAYLR_005157 [Chrysophaeum taylorii]